MTREPLLNTKVQQGAREDKIRPDSLGTTECWSPLLQVFGRTSHPVN